MEDMVADDAGAVEGRSRTAAPRCAVLYRRWDTRMTDPACEIRSAAHLIFPPSVALIPSAAASSFLAFVFPILIISRTFQYACKIITSTLRPKIWLDTLLTVPNGDYWRKCPCSHQIPHSAKPPQYFNVGHITCLSGFIFFQACLSSKPQDTLER